MQRRQQIGKAPGDVLAAARIEPRHDVAARVLAADRLDANAVPFPFGDVIGRVDVAEVRILDRMRQHHRPERRGIEIDGLLGAAFQPREQIEIGRAEPRPQQFDIVRVPGAEFRCRGLGEPRRNPDPHRAGHEFQQRPAAGLVQFVEPARELPWQLGLAERAQRGDDLGEGGRRRVVVSGRGGVVPGRAVVAAGENALPSLHARSAWWGGVGGGGSISRKRRFRDCGAAPHPRPLPAAARGEGSGPGVESRRPHQRHRLREVADVIIRQREQHRIGALGDQVANQSGLGVFERQRAGQRGERVAAIGILGLAEIAGKQPQLAIAAGLTGKPIEQLGEAVHASRSSPAAPPSSSSP